MTRLAYRAVGETGERYPAFVTATRNTSGVYVIRDRASHEVLYIGESHTGRLYGTLTRHFQQWGRVKGFWAAMYNANDSHDPGITYERSAVEVAIVVVGASRAMELEARMIAKLSPRDNALEPAPF